MDEIRIGDVLMMPATIELDRKIKTMPDNGIVVAVTADSSLLADIPSWCKLTGHRLLKAERKKGEYRFYIEKASEAERRNRPRLADIRPIAFGPDNDEGDAEQIP